MQHMTTADGVTGHHGHHGLGTGADLALEIQHVEVVGALVILIAAIIPPHLLISAGAEGQLSFTGEDDDTDPGIEAGILQGFHHLLHRQRPESIAHLGAVDGDLGNTLFRFVVTDILKVAAAVVPFDGRVEGILLCHLVVSSS